MGVTVNTNVSAMTAQRYLGKASDSLSTSMERLSTGSKINSAKDDAAGPADFQPFGGTDARPERGNA